MHTVKTKKTARMATALLTAVLLMSGIAFTGSQNGLAANAATSDAMFVSSYSSKAEALQAGLDLNEQIAEEGMILVKNENGALPLVTGKGTAGAKITVFGYAGAEPNAGSSKNGGDSSAGAAIALADVYSSLEAAGYDLNPVVKEQYESWVAAELTSDYAIANATADSFETVAATARWKTSLANYDDAALVVLSAGSGAIGENGRVHRLQLDAEQYELIDYAAANFDKVIVLINSCTPLEIESIQNDPNVDAIVLIGEPGDNGFNALGKVLSGEVNPSGRTSDAWAADFTANPSYYNFNTETNANAWNTDGNGNDTGYTRYTYDGEELLTWGVGYVEGIYVGYRYYETRGYEELQADPESTWYDENVTYTFGYGLSYTDFEWEVTPVTDEGAITKDDTLKFDVKVTNVGEYFGKDVVQLYYTAPYGTAETGNSTVIEKSYVVLGDYAKTKELAPGESQTLRLTIDVSDMASYDQKTDKTYVLDAGDYVLSIAKDAHLTGATSFTYNVAAKQLCNTAVTGNTITNQLDDVTAGFEADYTALSRADFDGTMSTAPAKTKALTEDEYNALSYQQEQYNDYYDVELSDLTYCEDASERTSDTYEFTLFDLVGASADDPRYQELVEQLTLEELADLINNGGFHSLAIDYIGLPYAFNTDGPKGWTGNYTDSADRFNYFSSEPLIASTFNKELAYEMGKLIGEQGLWGNSTQESGIAYTYTGWYAPGMNIHRSVFDSRYTEYYSEDPVLTGYTAANVSLGASEMGCYITMKHFAFHNDGGGASTYRAGSIGTASGTHEGLCAWMTEQTAREIYLKGYQITVEEGNATYMMASFTRIGATWCGGSYAINKAILRDEWGFEGSAVTDIVLYNTCNAYQLITAGGGTMLDAKVYGLDGGIYLDVDEINAMDDETKAVTIYCMQETVRQLLYMVANSNAMQTPAGARVVYSGMTENEDGEEVAIVFEDGTVGTEYTSPVLTTASINTYYAYADIEYTVSGLPAGMSFDAASGTVKGTPTKAGTYTITVTASAEGYQSASVSYTFVVNAAAEDNDYVTSDEVQDMIDNALKDTEGESSGGCGGAVAGIGGIACAIGLIAIGAAVFVTAKKKEN